MNGTLRPLLLLAMLLTMAPAAFGDTAVDYLNRGNVKYNKGDWNGAIEDYNRAIELKPDYGAAFNNRGNAKRKKGDRDGAVADYTQAIELKPDYGTAFDSPAQTPSEAGGQEGALSDFKKSAALAPGPDLAMPYKNRGDVKYDQRDLDGALADYRQAVMLKPDFAEAYKGSGDVKKDKGDLDGALADYNHAIVLEPDLAGAYNGRGMAKRDKGDLEGALADCSKAIELDPKYVWAIHTRGCLRDDAGDFKDALVDFRQEVALAPASDYAHFRIWLIRSRLGGEGAATAELQTYLAARSSGKTEDWSSKIGRFLAGQLTEPAFLAAVKNGHQKAAAGQVCQSYFYAGSKRLLAGDKAKAAEYFQKSIATDEKGCFEYLSAAAGLKFLKAQKN